MYSQKGSFEKSNFVVRVSAPYPIEEGSVNFQFRPGDYVCEVEFCGLPETFIEKVYGVDAIQAVFLAANVDGYLKGLEKKYDLYWLSGEPYFEE